jgi:protein-tyrosine phosphatase
MIKIMFVCHGNICRSPMAEFVFKDMVEKLGLKEKFYICSSATSNEEIGNAVHYGTKRKLKEIGIYCSGKKAVQLTKKDYENYDFFLCMDNNNVRNTLKIIAEDKNNKVHRFLDFTNNRRDIADPWYTGDFDQTYNDVIEGCEAFLEYIVKNRGVK